MRRNERGITLIALVVTIIVLLILAGASIAMLTGQNGVLTQASKASNQTKLADEIEKVGLSATGALAKDNGGEIIQSHLEEELANYFQEGEYQVNPGTNDDGTEGYIVIITENDKNGRKYFVDKNGNVTDYIVREPAEPTEGTGANFNMNYGVIEVEFLSGTSYNTTVTPNHPVLKEGMTAITYNESDGTVQNVSNSNGTDWYSYIETTDDDMSDGGTTNGGNSHWANAKVTVDNVDSYFVWIPRYAYRIIYFDSENSENAYRAGTLTEEDALINNQIEGYSDARGIVDVEGKTKSGVSEQTAISVNGKYFKTHPAFDGDVNYGGWSSKLEGIWVAKYEVSNAGNNKPKSEPGVSGWRNIKIGDMFTYSQGYNTNLNSHMMKNSEWGAVAYLTDSKYGRNGTEMTPNTSSSGYTGGSGVKTSFVTNKNQSTTGNVYGIYDLSGGSIEYVVGYYNKSSYLSPGSSFADGINKENSTAYTGTNAKSAYKYGDATYETSKWYNDSAAFVRSELPFFGRGGSFADDSIAGIFNFIYEDGKIKASRGFRICLAVQ